MVSWRLLAKNEKPCRPGQQDWKEQEPAAIDLITFESVNIHLTLPSFGVTNRHIFVGPAAHSL